MGLRVSQAARLLGVTVREYPGSSKPASASRTLRRGTGSPAKNVQMSLASGSEKQSLRARCAYEAFGSAADRIGHFVQDAFVPVASALVRAEADGVRHRDRARRLRHREARAVDRLDDLSAVADAGHLVPLPVDHVRSCLQLLLAERTAEHARCLPVLLDFDLDLATPARTVSLREHVVIDAVAARESR